MYTEKLIPGSMVAESPKKELVKIADRYNMEYIIATHDAFAILPLKVCTICIPYWKEHEFASREQMVDAANKAYDDAREWLDKNPKYRITGITATGFDVEEYK